MDQATHRCLWPLSYKSSRQTQGFLAGGIPSSLAPCCVSGDGGTRHTHTPCLKALCLPHCFRTLRGVISAVLHSLKKKQLFHVASSTQAEPSSFSTERAMGLDLQESLAWGRTAQCWAGRLPLAQPKPYLLRGTAWFHWSSFEKSGARSAP